MRVGGTGRRRSTFVARTRPDSNPSTKQISILTDTWNAGASHFGGNAIDLLAGPNWNHGRYGEN